MKDYNAGYRMYKLCEKIFPYCRSITGEGVRQTLRDIKDYIEDGTSTVMNICEVKTGTQVFDWNVPKEWVIREAYLEDEQGNKIIDMKENNLHVVGYSVSVDKWVELDELKNYIYTQPDQPNVIPYVTSYYKETFGLCMSENSKIKLKKGKYHIYIDSELIDGVLNYGEIIIPGASEKELFFSTYVCHPSMANNECSGPVLSAELVRYVSQMKNRKYTYRFIFIPETIGAITYLSQMDHLSYLKKNMVAGFNLTCVGDNYHYSIIETKYGNTLADKALNNILKKHTNDSYVKYSFLDRGSDERQYNSPGVDLPVVCFCRTKFCEFAEYHTSADNMDYVCEEGFQGSYDVITKMIRAFEWNENYKINVLCEPQLGPRGLYPSVSQKGNSKTAKKMMDLIVYADGKNDLFDISNIIGIETDEIIEIIKKLKEHNLWEIKNDT